VAEEVDVSSGRGRHRFKAENPGDERDQAVEKELHFCDAQTLDKFGV